MAPLQQRSHRWRIVTKTSGTQGLQACVKLIELSLTGMVAIGEAPPFCIHLHQSDHQHLTQQIAVMKVLNIKGSSCRGLPAVGEAHQFGIVIFAAGQYVVDLCSQQLCSAAETRPEALNR